MILKAGVIFNDYGNFSGAYKEGSLLHSLNEVGFIEDGETIPPYVYINSNIIASILEEKWIKQFGSVCDIRGKINTINGDEVELSNMDIGLLMLMRDDKEEFTKKYGIDYSNTLRFKAAMDLSDDPELKAALREAVIARAKKTIPYEYFNTLDHSDDPDHKKFHIKKWREDLRTRYDSKWRSEAILKRIVSGLKRI